MAEIVGLREAVAGLVRDGDTVAPEGFTHLIPFAAAHEIVRQGRHDLTLVRMTPDLVYEQIIGMGAAKESVFSWGGNPGVRSLHRSRDAVENGWPRPRRSWPRPRRSFIVLRHSKRAFVEKLAFATSVGHAGGGDSRRGLGYTGGGPSVVLTDLGILEPDPESGELTLVALHEGATAEEAREATGWDLKVAEDLATAEPPEEGGGAKGAARPQGEDRRGALGGGRMRPISGDARPPTGRSV